MSTSPFDTLLARPEQTLREHLLNVATLAQRFAQRFGCGDWARAEGLLHDIGKASDKFQRYIREVEKKPNAIATAAITPPPAHIYVNF